MGARGLVRVYRKQTQTNKTIESNFELQITYVGGLVAKTWRLLAVPLSVGNHGHLGRVRLVGPLDDALTPWFVGVWGR